MNISTNYVFAWLLLAGIALCDEDIPWTFRAGNVTAGAPTRADELGGRVFFTMMQSVDRAADDAVYIFGGLGITSDGQQQYMNDLFQFVPATASFTRIEIDETGEQPLPRQRAAGWRLTETSLILHGGEGFGVPALGDVWIFNLVSRRWANVAPCGAPSCPAVYGSRGVQSNATFPGPRAGAAFWLTSTSRCMLFGGRADIATMKADLWDVNILSDGSLAWTWIGGSPQDNFAGNDSWPAARVDAVTWVDEDGGHVYIYGGRGLAGLYADLWKLGTTGDYAATPLSAGFNAQTAGVVPLYPSFPGSLSAAFSWIESHNLWLLFGSAGYPGLWTFDLTTNTWSGIADYASQYIYSGEPAMITHSIGTHPNARFGGGVIQDATGVIWVLGGTGVAVDGSVGLLGDVFSMTGCAPSCGTCTGPSERACKSCAGGLFLANDGSCQACPASCTTCTAAEECGSCVANAVLVGDTCAYCDTSCATCNGVGIDNCATCHPNATRVRAGCQACPDGDCVAAVSNSTMSAIITTFLVILVFVTSALALRRQIDVLAESVIKSSFTSGFLFDELTIRLSLTKAYMTLNVKSKLPVTIAITERRGAKQLQRPIPLKEENGNGRMFATQITRHQSKDIIHRRLRLTVSQAGADEEVIPHFIVKRNAANVLAVVSIALEFLQLCAITFNPTIPWSSNDPMPPLIHNVLFVVRIGSVWRGIFWTVFAFVFVWLGIMILVFTKLDLKLRAASSCWKKIEGPLYEYFLATLGSTLYLTVLNVMLSAGACTESVYSNGMVEVNSQRLVGDESIICWHGVHWAYLFFALLVVLSYYPVAVLALPLWQGVSADLDVRLQPTFLLLSFQAKFLISTITSLFPSTPGLQPGVILTLVPVMLISMAYRQPSHIRWIQPTLICSYAGVLWASTASVIALLTHGNIGASIFLYIGWVIILGVLVYVHVRIQRHSGLDADATSVKKRSNSTLSAADLVRSGLDRKSVELRDIHAPTSPEQ